MTLKSLLPVAIIAVRGLTAANLYVPAGGDLQGALNSAKPGDTIQLAAGASFTGHFSLPANPGTQWITIQSSAISSLPAAGTRVSMSHASLMPKIITPDNIPAMIMSTGAAYYRFQGIEFTVAPGDYGNDIIDVGNGSESSVAALPHDIDFDRDYIHGDPVSGTKRGIGMNGANVTVENCYMSAFTSNWQDTQAIAGWNGSGPFKIVNNYLEAGTEIVAFGGATTAISGVIPSDILIQNNTFNKPLSWRPGSSTYNGMHVWAKNHIELKSAQRVTIDSNSFTNNWIGGDQRGFFLVFNVRCEMGAVPWAVVNNVTVTNNVLLGGAGGVMFVGEDGASNYTGQATNFLIQNNRFADINSSWDDGSGRGDGRLFQIQYKAQNITINHNTAFETGYLMTFEGDASDGLVFTNNIVENGNGPSGNGLNYMAAVAQFLTNYTWSNNIITGGRASNYPSGNFFPTSDANVGFVNLSTGNMMLQASSLYHNAGKDGKDIGYLDASLATTASAIPTGWVQVVNKNSGSCLDIIAWNGSELQLGTRIQQWACWGGQNQNFMFVPVAGGYKITNRASNYQIDIAAASTADMATIIQWPFWGGSNEIFSLVDAGNGYYTIRPNSVNKCIDVAGASTASGAPVVQYSCNGGANQQFKLVSVQ